MIGHMRQNSVLRNLYHCVFIIHVVYKLNYMSTVGHIFHYISSWLLQLPLFGLTILLYITLIKHSFSFCFQIDSSDID